jgi:hypothetical protein
MVDRMGEEFFPCSAFSHQKDRGIGPGCFKGQFFQFDDLLAISDNIIDGIF